jgi:NAD(P)-dependent dehydrogenase (short-subunit alcohol dehydrogenase family)
VPGPRFAGRRALVTGASRGIGAAIAERLAAEGAAVAITARTKERHDHLPGSSTRQWSGSRATEPPSRRSSPTFTDETERTRILPEARDALGGPLEILVNNAAAAIYMPVLEFTMKRQRILFEANVHAPFDLAQAAAPAMVDAGEGWIVNLSSATARHWHGPPFALGAQGTTLAMYGASKAALNRMTNGLAAELYGTGVRVNTVEPRAAVLSEGADALVGATLRPDQIETMEQMVEAVVALCHCAPDYTGKACVSLDLIKELALTVHRLDGTVE